MTEAYDFDLEKRIIEVESEMARLATRIEEWRTRRSDSTWTNPKQTGAIRRASMDLTRALVELRKPY